MFNAYDYVAQTKNQFKHATNNDNTNNHTASSPPGARRRRLLLERVILLPVISYVAVVSGVSEWGLSKLDMNFFRNRTNSSFFGAREDDSLTSTAAFAILGVEKTHFTGTGHRYDMN